MFRRSSTATIEPVPMGNALRFVQAKSDLDLRAKALIDKAKENKKKRAQITRKVEEQEQEWAADLENWKLRRSSSSTALKIQHSETDSDHKSNAEHNLNPKIANELISPTPATVSANVKMEFDDGMSAVSNLRNKSTNEVNEIGGGSVGSRQPISSNGDGLLSSSKNGAPFSSTNNINTGNGAGTGHGVTGIEAQAVRNTMSSIQSRSTSSEGVEKKKYAENLELNNKENSESRTEKFQALRNTFAGGNSNGMSQPISRGRQILKQSEMSRIAPVYAKIPNSDETAADSGVDSYRPESLTPSHESLSPGSQGSGDNSAMRKSSVDQLDFGIKSKNAINSFSNDGRPSWESKEGVQEILVQLELRREKGDRAFGFTLKGGHEKNQPIVVDSILPGSVADKSRMRLGDELLEIDGMEVSKAYLTMINATISQAAKAGNVELKFRRLPKRSETTVETSYKSRSTEKSQQQLIQEKSFDQKRLQFEKVAAPATATITREPVARQPTTAPVPASRRHSDFHSGGMGSSTPKSPLPTSPPPVNRYDFDPSNVGQLVARYTGPDEPSKFRSTSQDRNGNSTDKKSPYAERRRNPGKLADFVPEADRYPEPKSSSTRRFSQQQPSEESDYRVTSLQTKLAPGNILNFVPENDRKFSNGGDSLTKKGNNILDEREEIDQRWQKERARVLGYGTTSSALDTDKTKLYRVSEQKPIQNYDYNRYGSSKKIDNYDLGPRRSLSPPRAPPPPPPKDESDNYEKRDIIPPHRDYQPVNQPAPRRFSSDKPTVRQSTIINPPPTKSNKILDTDSACKKLDELLRKQPRQSAEVELQYLEMAANAAASGVDISSLRKNSDVHKHWLVREAEELRLTDQAMNRRQSATTTSMNAALAASSKPPPSPKYPFGMPTSNRYATTGSKETLTKKDKDDQQVMNVSAMQRCSHCTKELGRGAAMIIESLDLFFHLTCFKCYVCGLALSDGAQGADVRVRAQKLHCQRCYSSEDASLQFSEV